MSALVEKKTGFDGNRTLIQGGFCAWCNVGSILAQGIVKRYLPQIQKQKRCRRNLIGTVSLIDQARLAVVTILYDRSKLGKA